MSDPYRSNLNRNRYFQEMEYGAWYDNEMARRNGYLRWANEVNSRDEWARRNPPAPGSYEEHMAGQGSWTYGVDPYHAWRYGGRPAEEAVRRRDRGYGYWHPEEADQEYEWHWPRRGRKREEYEYYPERRRYVVDTGRRRRHTYDVSGGREYLLSTKYVYEGGRKERGLPKFHGKRIQIRRKWKEWPKVYVGNHPERHGIKVKTKWEDWPKYF